MFNYSTLLTNLRRYKVPAAEPVCTSDPLANVPALITFSLPQRDTVDYGLDMSDYLKYDSEGIISAATWSVASGSPVAVTIVDQQFSDNESVITVTAPLATVGSIAWLDCVMTIHNEPIIGKPITPVDRTIYKRVHLQICRG